VTRGPIPILFSIPNLETAGSRQVLFNLATRLDRRRWDPSVVVLRDGGRLADSLRERDIPVVVAPFCVEPRPYATLPLRVLAAARTLRAALAGPSPRLWHSFHYRDDYTEPLIARAAGTRRWIYTKKAMGWGSRGWRLRSRLASCIVVDNSEMIATLFASTGLGRRCRLVRHGVDVERFSRADRAEPPYRHRLGLPSAAPLVVSVADLVPIKGHPDLIRAVAACPGCHLALAGGALDSEYARSLRELAEGLGAAERVHRLGRIDDVPALLREADLFVLASRPPGEGCPVALLEAMAAGVACVATDVPGCREVVDSPAVGRLVPAERPDELARALADLLADPPRRRALAVAARERVLTEFTVDREVEALSLVYAELSS
jgi:starch synthase (maltosyl-transferring)